MKDLRTWAIAFVVLFVASAAWSLASPVGSGPDEPAQFLRAASIVRGELLGKSLPHAGKGEAAIVVVHVPESFASLANDVACFAGKPDVPAGCQLPLDPSSQQTAVDTYVGRYPPFYYVLVGLPTLLFVSVKGVYAARLASAALSAAMLALAVVSLRRCKGAAFLGAGLCTAITPMALYLSGVVNPSGLEVAAAISAWVSAMALLSERPGATSRLPLNIFGASALVLVLVRAMSPLWILFVLVAFIAIGPMTPLRAWLRHRPVRVWLGLGALAGAASLTWDLVAHATRTIPGAAVPRGASEGDLFGLALDRAHSIFLSTIGQFGWLDAPSLFGVVAAWCGALGAVLLVGLGVAKRRQGFVPAGLLACWLVFTVVFVLVMAPQHGLLGQGRDFMGLAVGVPIVAAATAGDRLAGREVMLRMSAVVVGVLAICQVVDFYGALRRNTVGLNGPNDAFASVPGGWQPPVPGIVLLAVFGLSVAAFAVVLQRTARAQAGLRPRPTDQAGPAEAGSRPVPLTPLQPQGPQPSELQGAGVASYCSPKPFEPAAAHAIDGTLAPSPVGTAGARLADDCLKFSESDAPAEPQDGAP